MAIILDNPGITFDDVLLVPGYSDVTSRFSGEIDLHTDLLPGISLKYPIISANMDTITECKMVRTMNQLGGLGIMHRYVDNRVEKLVRLSEDIFPVVMCIGVGIKEIDIIRQFEELMEWTSDAVLVDIAHGDSQSALKQIKLINHNFSNIPIIAGNIATADAAFRLLDTGVQCLKVGIGPGSLCSTRLQTGCGVPQITAIMDVYKARDRFYTGGFRPSIIADGGIRHPGDIVKALAAGADAVMIGNLFAGTDETPGMRVSPPWLVPSAQLKDYKVYRGMASKEVQEQYKGSAKSIEGVKTYVPCKGPISYIFDQLVAGIQSGFSYVGAHNINELHKKAVFIKQSSAGLIESMPHGKHY